MKLAEIIKALESVAPPSLQEDYDNSGLIVGSPDAEVKKALICLDSTEEVVAEAMASGCDLIIAHHPIVFRGLKKLNGSNYVERAVMKAVKNDIAIYACHTNLDNVLKQGVNSKIAEKLGLLDCSILKTMSGRLCKMAVFVPGAQAGAVRDAMFAAGAGNIGNYSECSFNLEGSGTFRAGEGTNPFVGEQGQRHTEREVRVEAVVPRNQVMAVWNAIRAVHPYEEVAYDIYGLENRWEQTGSGLIGRLLAPMAQHDFLAMLKNNMELPLVRYTSSSNTMIERVAVCGGAGSFLISNARAAGADAYVTSDIKYHEFFDAENQLLLCDIGHYESEKFTGTLFAEILSAKFPNFATIFAKTLTNPVNYYF